MAKMKEITTGKKVFPYISENILLRMLQKEMKIEKNAGVLKYSKKDIVIIEWQLWRSGLLKDFDSVVYVDEAIFSMVQIIWRHENWKTICATLIDAKRPSNLLLPGELLMKKEQ